MLRVDSCSEEAQNWTLWHFDIDTDLRVFRSSTRLIPHSEIELHTTYQLTWVHTLCLH